MFQSIEYKRHHGYNAAIKQYECEFELIDSDFSCVAVGGAGVSVGAEDCAGAVGVVIQEYGKRNLNVATNLIRYFRFYEKEYGYSIAEQIRLAEKYQPLFTPEIKAALDKYLILL
jgi:hypothetical protein